MDIRLSIFPTDMFPKLIAYNEEYKLRNNLYKSIYELVKNDSIYSDSAYPYQIIFNADKIIYLTYSKGRAIETLLNYISHRYDSEYDINVKFKL